MLLLLELPSCTSLSLPPLLSLLLPFTFFFRFFSFFCLECKKNGVEVEKRRKIPKESNEGREKEREKDPRENGIYFERSFASETLNPAQYSGEHSRNGVLCSNASQRVKLQNTYRHLKISFHFNIISVSALLLNFFFTSFFYFLAIFSFFSVAFTFKTFLYFNSFSSFVLFLCFFFFPNSKTIL